MFRAAKNKKGLIICIAPDEGQKGNYPAGTTAKTRLGVWCKWNFKDVPAHPSIEGASHHALRFKENDDGCGLELRSDEEVLSSPDGQ